MDLEQTYKGKTVLVTGHSGFKGGWLSLWLHSLGANVCGYSISPITRPNLFDTIKVKEFTDSICGDIKDYRDISTLIKHTKPDFIFHLAAQPIVRTAYESPAETIYTNAMGTVNVLDAIRKSDHPTTAIFITSDKCYDNREWVYSYRENDMLGGHDPYSSSKAMAELAIKSYHDSFYSKPDSIHAIASARAGNIIGGGDWSEDRIIPDIIKAFSKNNPVMLRNPYAIRPWQFVLDALYGYLLLGAKLKADPKQYSGAWNFGPDPENCITVRDLAQTVKEKWRAATTELITITSADNKHESNYLRLDSTKSRTMLRWKPKYNVYQAVEKTVSWYNEYYSANSENMKEFSLGQIKKYQNI